MKFEEAVKKLEEIANKLEKNECTLEESIKLYEEAALITKQCNDIINNAKLKIDEIKDLGKD